MDKNSSLLRKFVNYGQKEFYNIGPWSQIANVPYCSYLVTIAIFIIFLEPENYKKFESDGERECMNEALPCVFPFTVNGTQYDECTTTHPELGQEMKILGFTLQ